MNTYTIDNRKYTLVNDFATELSTIENDSIFDLSYLQVIKLMGNNIESFLQGQLTCNIDNIYANNIIAGALCNIQGRIICIVYCIIFKDEFYLICPKDLVTILLKNLNLSAQLSKIILSVSNDINLYGLYAETKPSTHDNNIYNLSNNTYLVVTETSSRPNYNYGSLAWHYHRIKDNYFEIYPCSHAIFLPHKLDLEKTNIISFNKGCYKGQEIIARMHYKSKKTHNLCANIIYSQQTFAIGSLIENYTNLGVLVDYCPTIEEHKYYCLFTTPL